MMCSLVVVGIFMCSSSGDAADYLKDIKPVLKERCYSCHGSLKQKGDLRVDTAAEMIGAKVIVPGDVAASELFGRITSDDDNDRMPPEGHALSAPQITAIQKWIESGAPLPPNEVAEDDPGSHWSFQPIRKPAVPKLPEASNPVDAFLLVKQRDAGVHAQEPAERSILLRRVYLDLIGLAPTNEQLDDDRPLEAIVDELLGSLHHGERWGRHWMDVWRYSDWYGLGSQLRYSQKHLWHWREWIVESLNEDKGYDEMIHEMLAGDELAPEDPDTLRATGFLARNYFLFNRTTWLDSTIEHTGKAFLGLTLNCAKCHDHKYDPIDFEDYYRFRAIFEPHQVRLDAVPGETNFEKDGVPRVFDDHLDAKTYLHLRGDPKQEDKETTIVAGVPAFLAQFAPEVQPVSLPVPAYAPGTQTFVQEDRLEEAVKKVDDAREELKKATAALAKAADEPDSKEEQSEAAKTDSDFRIEDDFASPKPGVWVMKGSGLVYKDGGLEQSEPTQQPARLVSKKALPRDFEMTCRYTTTGGATHKSISFRFDLTENEKHSNFIYTSERAEGAKVQAAYTRGGKTTYAGDGRAGKKVAVGRPQELRIAVRDRLANVWLDGKFVLAYQFPDRIADGRFALSAFDATARFHSIRITGLQDDLKLTEAKNASSPDTAKDGKPLQNHVEIAELALAAAIADEAALKATIAADAASLSAEAAPAKELTRAALKLQIEAKKARAAADLLIHKDGDAKKRKAAEQLAKSAKEKWAAFEKGEGKYEPLRGSRKALETPAHKTTDYPAVYASESTGRRTMLAKWITDPENPLTARVAVNHVWMRHFGEPLVETVFDFGRQAPQPLHHELLDYLAAEFVESGWSFRHLHRLLVTSQTYQQSSSNAGGHLKSLKNDPGNRLYWRMNPRRMESQVVRDNLLYISAKLDLTVGGPSLNYQQAGNRRSLYFTHSPDKIDPFLTTFDDADLLQCYRRSESVVPQQALALSNSKLALESARLIAEKIGTKSEAKTFIKGAFMEVLSRQPNVSETTECLLFLDDLKALNGKADDRLRFRAQLVHALLNHNDFVTIR